MSGIESKPRLSWLQILEMNLGFLGLQFSFGLQQANMSPIWGSLGAQEENFAWLGVAGPLTGFLLQPIIGSMSDRTSSRWGRRTPYFIIGAVLCCLGLFFMPYSSYLLMAFSLLLILDVGNNVTMEPYRAYVNDRLDGDQRGFGFLSQSAFTGLAQTLAYLMPNILVWMGMSREATGDNNIPEFTRVAFLIGAVLSISTILYSIFRVPELPLSESEKKRIAALPKTASATFAEIFHAMRDMPKAMRQMGWMSLFQWFGMNCYWVYIINSLSRSLYGTADAKTQGYRDAQLANGEMGAFFNLVACVAAFGMAPLSRRFGAGRMHALCLTLSGIGMMALPFVENKSLIFIPAIGVGLGWGSIMGNPYIILANAIPPERTGVYMGIFNMFITAPMLLFAATMKFMYEPLFGGDARNVIMFAGVCLVLAAISVLFVKNTAQKA
jgi:maltose/moltooligosaccharide transporter